MKFIQSYKHIKSMECCAGASKILADRIYRLWHVTCAKHSFRSSWFLLRESDWRNLPHRWLSCSVVTKLLHRRNLLWRNAFNPQCWFIDIKSKDSVFAATGTYLSFALWRNNNISVVNPAPCFHISKSASIIMILNADCLFIYSINPYVILHTTTLLFIKYHHFHTVSHTLISTLSFLLVREASFDLDLNCLLLRARSKFFYQMVTLVAMPVSWLAQARAFCL
jgi:hypothetical protein